MKRALIALSLLVLAGCTSAQVQDTKAKADAVVAKATEEINMACWAMQTASVAFDIVVAPKADPDLVAAVHKAVDVANAICPPNEIPTNVNEAIAAILKAYRVASTATAVTGI